LQKQAICIAQAFLLIGGFMDYKALFAAVQAAMKKERLTIAQVARFTGMNGGALGCWLRDVSTPTANEQVASFFKIIDMFKIDIEPFADTKTIGGRIEFMRLKNKFTVADLATIIPCGLSTICRWERNEVEPDRKLNHLAVALKTTTDYIVNGDAKPEIRNGLIGLPTMTLDSEKEPSNESPFSIEIYLKQIGGDDVNAVNARELWEKLGVVTKFADWVKRRIDEYGFKNDFDFCVLKNENGESSGFQPIEYFISLDMAKELSMVENNEQGRKARRYFIECEKAVKSKVPAQKIDHLSPEVIMTLQQARRVQQALCMNKKQAAEYARDLILDRFGFDIEKVTTGESNNQLKLRLVK
jgi:phage anti-repressor protein